MSWDKLSFREKAEYIKIGVKNGLTNIDDIKGKYNTFAEGGPERESSYSAGHLMDAIYENSIVEGSKNPSHHYDVAQSEEWANAHGYYPDARGHIDDRVKKVAHPTHPSRGHWNGIYQFELSEKGMRNPNHTLFGVVDKDQDPQATLTYKGSTVLPEITVTPKGNYIYNSYDDLRIHKRSNGGNLFGDGGDTDNPDVASLGFWAEPITDAYNGIVEGANSTMEAFASKANNPNNFKNGEEYADATIDWYNPTPSNSGYARYTTMSGNTIDGLAFKRQGKTYVTPDGSFDNAVEVRDPNNISDTNRYNSYFNGNTDILKAANTVGRAAFAIPSTIFGYADKVTNLPFNVADNVLTQLGVDNSLSDAHLLNRTLGMANAANWAGLFNYGDMPWSLENRGFGDEDLNEATALLTMPLLTKLGTKGGKAGWNKITNDGKIIDQYSQAFSNIKSDISNLVTLYDFYKGKNKTKVKNKLSRVTHEAGLDEERKRNILEAETSEGSTFEAVDEIYDIKGGVEQKTFTNPITGETTPVNYYSEFKTHHTSTPWYYFKGVDENTGLVKIEAQTPSHTYQSELLELPQQSVEIQKSLNGYLETLSSTLPDDVGYSGSTLLAKEGLIPKLPGDIEFIVLDKDVDTLHKSIQSTGHTRSLGHGMPKDKSTSPLAINGEYDVDILETTNEGQAIGKLAHEIYAALHPEEYQEFREQYVKNRIAEGNGFNNDIETFEYPLPISGKDLLKEYNSGDNSLRLQISNYLSSTNQKHVKYETSLLSNKKYAPLVRDVIINKARSYIKDYMGIHEAYPNLDLSNVAANEKVLIRIGLPKRFAKDPEIMETVAEKLQYDNLHGRSVKIEDTYAGVDYNTRLNSNTAAQTGSGAGGNSTFGPGGGTQYGNLTAMFQRNFPKDKVHTLEDFMNLNDKMDRRLNKKIPSDELNKVKDILRNAVKETPNAVAEHLSPKEVDSIIDSIQGISDIDSAIINIFKTESWQTGKEEQHVVLAKIKPTQEIAKVLGIPGAIGGNYDTKGRYFGIYSPEYDRRGLAWQKSDNRGLDAWEVGSRSLDRKGSIHEVIPPQENGIRHGEYSNFTSSIEDYEFFQNLNFKGRSSYKDEAIAKLFDKKNKEEGSPYLNGKTIEDTESRLFELNKQKEELHTTLAPRSPGINLSRGGTPQQRAFEMWVKFRNTSSCRTVKDIYETVQNAGGDMETDNLMELRRLLDKAREEELNYQAEHPTEGKFDDLIDRYLSVDKEGESLSTALTQAYDSPLFKQSESAYITGKDVAPYYVKNYKAKKKLTQNGTEEVYVKDRESYKEATKKARTYISDKERKKAAVDIFKKSLLGHLKEFVPNYQE